MVAFSSLMPDEATFWKCRLSSAANWRKTSVRAFSAVASLVALTLSCSSPSAAQDFQCPSPAQQTNSNLRVEVDGKAQTVLRLGAADLKGSVERTVEDLYSKYPNADRVAIASMMLSTTCQLIRNSRQLTNSEKFEKWMAVLQIIRTFLPDDRKSERREETPSGPATNPPNAAGIVPPTPPTGQMPLPPSQSRPGSSRRKPPSA